MKNLWSIRTYIYILDELSFLRRICKVSHRHYSCNCVFRSSILCCHVFWPCPFETLLLSSVTAIERTDKWNCSGATILKILQKYYLKTISCCLKLSPQNRKMYRFSHAASTFDGLQWHKFHKKFRGTSKYGQTHREHDDLTIFLFFFQRIFSFHFRSNTDIFQCRLFVC